MLLTWLALLIEGLFTIPFHYGIEENSFIYSFIIIFINSIVVFCFVSKEEFGGTILGGYLLRCAFLVWDCNFKNVFLLPNSGQDMWTFHNGALSGLASGDFGRGGTYSKILSLIYRLFGVQIPIAQYVNLLISISTIILLVKIMNVLEISERTKRVSVNLICFLPNFAIINILLLRESIITYCVTLSLYFFVKWYKTSKISYILFCIVASSIGAIFHSGAIAIALGAFVMFLLYHPEKRRFNLSPVRVLFAFACLGIFIIINNQYDDIFLSRFSGLSAESIIDTAGAYNDGGSAYDVGFAIGNSYLNLIVNTPLRMLYFVASPMPWDWRGFSDIIAFVFDSLFFIYVIWTSLKTIRYRKFENNSQIVIFLFLALISAAVFAWGVSNAGSAIRHREKFLCVYVILLAVCRDCQNQEDRMLEEMQVC